MASNGEITTQENTPMQDINKVLEECKIGRFHVRLLFAAFAGSIACAQVTFSSSYILPIAECDLDMNLNQKGLLNAVPYIGMTFSSILSGYLIDTFGRILFMKVAYGGIFIFALLSALSQNFEMIVAAKFCEGLLTAVAINGLSSITSEFCHPNIRDRVLLFQMSFGAIAQITCPLMAWAILVQNWELKLFSGAFILRIWNIYLFSVSLWSLSGYILFSTIPESPKFLVTRQKYLEAKKILTQVYIENTGKGAETFPFKNLWNQKIKDETTPKATVISFGHQLMVGLRNIKPLLMKPLLGYLTIIAGVQFIDLGTYNVLRLWFPQLSTIVEHYKLDGNQNLCVLLDKYTAEEKLKSTNDTYRNVDECVPHITGSETYINSMIIGLVCIVPFFVSGVVVNKVGKKCLLIVSGLISFCGLLGIRWASSKTMMVTLFAVDVAIMQIIKGLTQMVLVEVFPTTMRSLAMAIMMSLARIGILVGNIGFPILLGMGCELPFYVMAGMMIFFIILCVFMPKKERT